MTEPFHVQFVAGVTPDKWSRIWSQRMPQAPLEMTLAGPDPVHDLRIGSASMCFVRLPVQRQGLHIIPLYEEVPVALVGKDHPVASFERVDVRDLADEPLVQPSLSVPEWAAVAQAQLVERADALPEMTHQQAISVVASGAGVAILPLSLARLYHRRDVVHRPVTGVASTTIGLAWRVDDDDDRIETFIGVVRGRTERSTRGGTTASEPVATPSSRAKGPKDAPVSSRRSSPKRAGVARSRKSADRRRKRR